MPAHASEDAHPSQDAVLSEGPVNGTPLTRRWFLTYVVAAPALTVAAGTLIPPARRTPSCRARRSRRTSPTSATS